MIFWGHCGVQCYGNVEIFLQDVYVRNPKIPYILFLTKSSHALMRRKVLFGARGNVRECSFSQILFPGKSFPVRISPVAISLAIPSRKRLMDMREKTIGKLFLLVPMFTSKCSAGHLNDEERKCARGSRRRLRCRLKPETVDKPETTKASSTTTVQYVHCTGCLRTGQMNDFYKLFCFQVALNTLYSSGSSYSEREGGEFSPPHGHDSYVMHKSFLNLSKMITRSFIASRTLP